MSDLNNRCSPWPGLSRPPTSSPHTSTSGNAPISVLDAATRNRAAQWLGRAGARLPTFAELADPSKIPQPRVAALRAVDADRPDPGN
ncbi:MAG TPA: hypothetical protein VGN21_14540, partial [Stellaceae bacterium]